RVAAVLGERPRTCAGFANTPPSSVRMLGTSATEVLQDRDGRMRVHVIYNATWSTPERSNLRRNMDRVEYMGEGPSSCPAYNRWWQVLVEELLALCERLKFSYESGLHIKIAKSDASNPIKVWEYSCSLIFCQIVILDS
ncbi:hypothetical protein PanWU01x14_007760, partial [Parasponia andersonii]